MKLLPESLCLAILICGLSGAAKDEFQGEQIPPQGWKVYASPEMMTLKDGILHFRDTDATRESGLTRVFAVEAGKTYEINAAASAVPGQSWEGAFIQLRALPSNQLVGGMIKCDRPGIWVNNFYQLTMPPGTTGAQVFLYTHRGPTPEILIRSVTVTAVSGERPSTARGYVPPIAKLKDLNLETDLSRVTIQTPARYRSTAERLAAALAEKTGQKPRIVPDTERVSGHRVLLGNRDTNAAIELLYRQYFAYTDTTCPGKGGYEFRTIHNPGGDRSNVILLGGSDDAGVAAATERLIARTEKLLPPVIDVKNELPAPQDIKTTDYRTRMCGGFPGYGWNTLSWYLELYYRTGDRKYAREFIRLAFPDAEGIKELKAFNAESFWDFSRPLSTPYHYMGHYLILLWDLVEEQDAFSDEERLQVTRALADQLTCDDINQHYVEDTRNLRKMSNIGSRHDQWSANCLYFLARYFRRDYPHPVWDNAIAAAENSYLPLFQSDGWIRGEGGIIGWYPSGTVTGTAAYLVMQSKRPAKPGPYYTALDFFEAFWDGTDNSEIFETAAPHAFRQAAEVTGDGKYLFYAEKMKERNNSAFKLGQAYVSNRIAAREPQELCNRWLNVSLPPQACREFNLAPPWQELLLAASYRDTLDGGGDAILFDLFNEEYRTAYQLNSLYRLRIDGVNYLNGFGNYLQNTLNGAASAHIPTTARLIGNGICGDMIFHASQVPDLAYGNWERHVLLKKRRFAVIADRLSADRDGNFYYLLFWQFPRGTQALADGSQLSWANGSRRAVIDAAGLIACEGCHKGVATLKKGESVWSFTVIGQDVRAFRLSDRAALLETPERYLVFSGNYPPFGSGKLVLVGAEDIFRDGRLEKTSTEQKAALAATRPPTSAPSGAAAAVPEKTAMARLKLPFLPDAWEPVSLGGKDAILAGKDDRTVLMDWDGKILLDLATPGGVRCLAAGKDRLLAGTKDEHLYAFDLQGKTCWTHRAECATPPEKQKHFYWYKGAYPGIYALLAARNGEIYTGGACTVERLSPEGRVLARYEQFWGPATRLGELPLPDGSSDILAVRTRSADSLIIWTVNTATGRNRRDFMDNLEGYKNFPLFGSLKRNFMVIADVNEDGVSEVVADASGMYVWINLFDASGRCRAQVNLGPRPALSGLAAGKNIVAAVNSSRQLICLDAALRPQWCRDLPEKPFEVWVAGNEVIVADSRGLLRFNRDGRCMERCRADGAQEARQLPSGGIAVLDGQGVLQRF